MIARDCRFSPHSSELFLVATETGSILNRSRFNRGCAPSSFHLHYQQSNPTLLYLHRQQTQTNLILPDSSSSSQPRSNHNHSESSDSIGVLVVDAVTSIDFNPFLPDIFIAGYESGHIAMFNINSDCALLSWHMDASQPIQRVKWSPHRPAVFYVLTAESELHVWDVLEREAAASYNVRFAPVPKDKGKYNNKTSHSNNHVTSLCWSPSAAAAMTTASMVSLAAASSRSAAMVVCFSDGRMECHRLNEELAETAVDEDKAFAAWVATRK